MATTCPITNRTAPDYVTFGHLVVLQSLFQPRLSGEFLDYTDEVQFSNASVQAVGHLEQMTGGNYFPFDIRAVLQGLKASALARC